MKRMKQQKQTDKKINGKWKNNCCFDQIPEHKRTISSYNFDGYL